MFASIPRFGFIGLGLLAMLGGATAKELAPDKAWGLLEDLSATDGATREKAEKRLLRAGDATVSAGLMELVFFRPPARPHAVRILEALLGEAHGTDFKAWIELIGRREDIVPKRGYLRFKARLFSQLDPAFADFLDESAPRTIRPEEIVWGGVKKDGIPALRNPKTIPAGEATWLEEGERVFGVEIAGEARAYPHRILDWHEMANDVISGRPVSLSYCTLCGSGILFDTAVAGETYTFGSSGLLYRSNKLMYDHQTNTLWSNLTGEPVLGKLVGRGVRLRVLPMVVTTWSEWRRRHPETSVVSLETGYQRDYRPGMPYGEYFASPDTMFPVWKKPGPASGLEPKSWVWALEVGGVRKAYPLTELLKQPVLHDRIGATDIVLITDPASEAVRVYASGARRLRADARGWVDEGGEVFRLQEEALVSDRGTRLERVPGHRAYWFGWFAFFPAAEVYRP